MRLIRMFFRTIKESIVNIFRHGWLSFSAILSITVTLLLTSVLLVASMNIQNATKVVEQGLTAQFYLKHEVTEPEALKIKAEIEKMTNVKEVIYSSEEQEFDNLMEAFDEKQREALAVYRNDNPLNKVLIITMDNPNLFEALQTQLTTKYESKIYEIRFSEEIADTVLPVFDTIRSASLFLILAVAFVAIILISNTIRITIVARRTEIGIMRLVAASNWYIRMPFIFEGVFLGVLGALIATGVTMGGYGYYLPVITEKLSFGTAGVVLTTDTIFPQVLISTLIIGGLIGFIGSFFPVRKYLKK